RIAPRRTARHSPRPDHLALSRATRHHRLCVVRLGRHYIPELAAARRSRLHLAPLTAVVEDCVHAVGVDVNTASTLLLSRVSGIGEGLARSIVSHHLK